MLLHEGLPETTEIHEMQQIKILLLKESMGIHHKGFGNHKGVHPVRLRFTDVVIPQSGCLDRVQDTETVPFGEKNSTRLLP